jgi:hypothetical protein
MPIGILEDSEQNVNNQNNKIVICIDKNIFDNFNNLSINDLLENIRILLKYILSQNTEKVKLRKAKK